ncbi:MAG: SDR family NAD(P)-dependent oxidoreductase, partial [Rhodospirillaceae bacterium]
MRGLKDRTVVVTGGGNGIGAAVCRRFGEEGAKVAVWDIDAAAAEAMAAAIPGAG